MKKKLNKIIIIVLGAIMIPIMALADYTAYQQLVFSSDTAAVPTGQVIQGLGGLSAGSIASMDLYFNCGSSGTAVGRINEYSNSTYGSLVNTFTSANTATLASGSAIYNFTFTGLTINTANYYAIGVQSYTGCSSAKLKGSSSGTAYVDDTTTYKCFSGSCSPVKDLYFKINYAGTQPPTVAITYPPTGSSGLENFGLWRLTYANHSAYNNLWINLFVNTTSTVSNANYLWFDQEIKSGAVGVHDTVMNRLPQTVGGGYASGTTYYAIANLYSANAVLATSTVVSFSVGDVAADFVFPHFISPTFASSTAQGSQLCGKFPFSYWCDFTDLWASLTATSTTDSIPALSITLPSFTGGASTSVAIISASGINSMLGASNVSLLRTLIAYGLWVSFGFYIYERIKHHDI